LSTARSNSSRRRVARSSALDAGVSALEESPAEFEESVVDIENLRR
jgi:hypothetical protein